MKFSAIGSLLVFSSLLTTGALAEEIRHASYPDVSKDELVFVYRDAIWLAPLAGGKASLLSDVGERVRDPKFSPDGAKVAFSATVAGNQDVYVVARTGGPVVRVTNHPARDYVLDWHVDGEQILFKSTMQSPRAVYNQMFSVGAGGGLPRRLPLPYVESASLSADGKTIVFSYLRDFQEEVWKRYLGGRAPDLWSFDLTTLESSQLTRHPGPDSVPMQLGDDIYFLSERGPGQRSNLWLHKSEESARQITFFTDDDLRNPSIGPAGIVFQAGGDLFVQPFSSAPVRKIELKIEIARDERRVRRLSVSDRVEGGSIGPTGQLAFEARGDVFIHETKQQLSKNLSNSSSVAERFPSVSPSGRYLAYLSDRGGEYQVTILDLRTNRERQLTRFESGFRYRPFWSPDEKFLVFMDQQQRIWLLNVKTGDAQPVDQGSWRYHWDMPQFRISWSPDSRWFTWSRAGENRNQQIYVYDTKNAKRDQLTSGFFSDFDPVFDPSGNYIVALSYRSFAPTFGDIDPTFTYTNSMTVSLIPLTGSVGTPADLEWAMPQVRQRVSIDIENAEARLRTLPFSPGRFSALSVAGGRVTLIRSTGMDSSWEVLELGSDAPKVSWTANRVQVFDASEGRTLARVNGERIVLLDASKSDQELSVETKSMRASVNLQEEFLQMFDDSWRYQRDFFYDPNMHGVDWPMLKAHYRPLAAAAYTVQELTSVVREMHAELAAGHVYVSVEPPYNRSDAKTTGLLGVDFGVRNGRYFFAKILKPGVRRFEHRSPLDDSALGFHDGDFLLAVNGRELDSNSAPWEAFEGLAGELAELTIARTESGMDKRSVVVRLLSSERKLRELDWVEKTRQWVSDASDGKIGYIYVPNTGVEGQNELMQMYRAQYHKEALIIDERFNTGGKLGDRFVELLNRPPLNYFSSRNARDYPLPELAHRGPKAMLINSWSYSGGDGFPFLFKEAALGPLIGSQTWGGLIGPGMRMSLVNGGFVSAPPQRVYDTRGNWAEGNEGVRPNIAVRNNPGQLAQGNDQQLQKAIDYLLEELKSQNPPRVPAYPDKVSNRDTPSKAE